MPLKQMKGKVVEETSNLLEEKTMKRKSYFVIMLFVTLPILVIGCATAPAIINNDLTGTWYCTLEQTGETMEISITGKNYNIKVNDADNNSGVIILERKYGSPYITFNAKRYINSKNRWKKSNLKMSYAYKIENGQLTLTGGVYKGTYTKQQNTQTDNATDPNNGVRRMIDG